MTALTWQALLFLTAAYFAGCCLGCILRRIFWLPRVAVPEVVTQPVMATASQGAGATAALSRAAVETRPLSVTQEPVRRAQSIEEPVVAERQAVAATAPVRKEEPRVERVVEARPQERQPAPAAAPVPRVEETAIVAAPDDLKRIRLIDADIEAKLHALGVRRFAEIAQWTAADVARIGKELGFMGRIQHENWIEQAQVLAKGGETHYARRLARGEIVAAQVVRDEGESSPIAVAREKPSVSGSQPDVADRAAFAVERALPKEDRPAPVVPRDDEPSRPLPVGMARDSLQRIRGINTEIEDLIGRQGVARYTQIASWTKVDVDRFDQLLGQSGRIARENWIEQAQILAKGGDTSYSREVDRLSGGEAAGTAAEAETAKSARSSDLSGLRSVRSEALRGTEASDQPRQIGAAGRIELPNDLKRIRGIGVLIEKRLHAMGITSYAHIANWTAADIDRISQSLDFKGRIERENWVEQARILAAGGQTEFSRRFDRTGGQA